MGHILYPKSVTEGDDDDELCSRNSQAVTTTGSENTTCKKENKNMVGNFDTAHI